ncbi:hypothetical protein LOK49_LG07G02083 [Camellia lanceoleosa]|uniref:Uncharacterized protein n=1 Tax=Camellia lanceoleosa TaxID=1840588 RepID=A0ACC0H4X1_9ERIC|nr:hypothetical protein LOK49_LG07G02083 [Camellia lanceoleosa]
MDMVDDFVEKRVCMAHPPGDCMRVKSNDMYNPVRNAVNDVVVATDVEKTLNPMADIEMRNKANEGMIAKLEEEVVRLKSKMELQAVNIVGGFECVMKVKDEEIQKLQNENKEMRQTISMLEDQLADHHVHNVTQAFCEVDVTAVGASRCGVGSRIDVAVVHDVTPIRGVANMCGSVAHVDVHTVSNSSSAPLRSVGDVSLSDHEVQVLPYVEDDGHGVAGQNSFVCKINTKVRKELRLKDYDYPLGWERGKRTVTHTEEGLEVDKCNVNYAVIDIDTVGVPTRKWAVIWTGVENGVSVYFIDIKNLICGDSVRGNVIDTYANILLTEQANVSSGDDLIDKSYFFNNICMDVIKSSNAKTMESYVLKNFASSKDYQYIHFPICNQSHWTLVVYDAKDESWKHFNPMRQRSNGRSDMHYNEALVLKE